MSLSEVREQYLAGALSKPEYISRMHELHESILEYPEFIGGSDVASICVRPDGVVLETSQAGIRLRVDAIDERLIPIEILNFGSYETSETAMFLRLAETVDTVFDIGANIGWYSLNVSQRFGASVDVHAFEPIPATFAQLTENIALNAAMSINANNIGFSDESCEKTFFYYPQGSGNASTRDLSKRSDVEKITCIVRTLDEYVAETGVAPGLVKCDVEGAEFLVFRGGEKVFSEIRPMVFTELLRKWAGEFGYSPNDVIDWLAERGYACFVIEGACLRRFGRMDEGTAETNFLFLHEGEHASQISALETPCGA